RRRRRDRGLKPEVLATEHVADGVDPEPGRPDQRRQGAGGEERAVLVEEVPDSPVLENPLDAWRLQEYPGPWALRECLPHRAQQPQGSRHVLDHVTTNDDVGRQIGAAAAEELPPEGEPTVEIARRSV